MTWPRFFISHSARDTRQIDFLNKAFASTNVQAKYEEIEAIVQGKRNAAQIRADILASNAIMVLLGQNAETQKHTRDWVVWESGNAAGANKEVWVLEAHEDLLKISVVIPHVQHYVCFHYNDSWIAYLRQIISSYDDSHVAKAALAGAGVGGAAFGPEGALVGAGAGFLLAAVATPQRPIGTLTMCPQCSAVYRVHIVTPWARCAICNVRLQFAMAQAVGA